MTDGRLFAVFDSLREGDSLPELSLALLRQQQTDWPQLIEGYEALRSVRVREVQCDGYRVFLQFNPRRIVSTGAKVDRRSVRERKCFLCVEHLPAEQKGVLYNGQFLVLCNPAPILDRHYTISNLRHIEQSLGPHVETMIALAKDLSPDFTLYYNGPRCGASAPDHIHFQAAPRGSIPIEQDSEAEQRRRLVGTVESVSVFTLRNLGREVILLEGDNAADIRSALMSLLSAMQQELSVTDEPMVNIACVYLGTMWRMIIFPRRRHRPDAYFKEGNERILISPASIDMGGLVVTPIEKDFNTVDSEMIRTIFAEVSLKGAIVERILGKLLPG